MWKYTFFLFFLLIAIAGYFFWTSKYEQHTPQIAPGHVGIEDSPREENTGEIKPVPRRVKTMMEYALTEEELTSKDWQEWMQLVESPEFEAFLETRPTRLTDFFDFYESQGMKSYKSEVFGMVRSLLAEHFPAETAEALEPSMRQELSGIFAESGIEFEQAIQDFVSKEQNIAWVTEYFEGDFLEFGKWASNVLENPVSLPRDNPSAVGETPPPVFTTENESSDESFGEATTTETAETPTENTVPPLPENNARITEDVDIETEIQKLLESTLPETPKTQTLVDVEKDLRDRFSPQRYNTALQTLNRYGPEEGLRRLQKSDPEVATHLEQLIQRKQEND